MQLKATSLPVGNELIVDDYAEVLELYDFDYRDNSPYYQVGQPEKVQGWILHLSAIWPEIPDLLKVTLPLLKEYEVPFKVAQNKSRAIMLADGNLGYGQVGKIICIYPCSDEMALILAKELLNLTKEFNGGNIPTDYHLGAIVYTRFGSFNPINHINVLGQVERYIYNADKQLIRDDYRIPFVFPKHITWPFGEIVDPIQETPTTFLTSSYKIFSVLKTDARGRVMKSLRLKGLRPQWIIIKEARKGVSADIAKRDVRDRLIWQHHLLNELYGKITVPKVYDFFTVKGNSYLAMEYVRGKPLNQVIVEITRYSVWYALDKNRKLQILDLLLKLIDTVDAMHQSGYVHRDLNPLNFILDRRGRLIAIDLEMAYSIEENRPDPPFTLGTPGYMSPEQRQVMTPEVKQDIYSLGALMIPFFTSLNPEVFEQDNIDLGDDLNFFIRNKTVSQLIVSCLKPSPDDRPDLNTINDTLKQLGSELDTEKLSYPINKAYVDQIIHSLVRSLGDEKMVFPGEIWHSHSAVTGELLNNIQSGVTIRPDWYAGVSGVMYVLAKAKCEGYDLGNTEKVYLRSWEYLKNNFLKAVPEVVAGLYHGAAGIALAIAEGIKAGLVEDEPRTMIEKCLDLPITSLSIGHGIAGQGLITLRCLDFVTPEVGQRILGNCVDKLIESQHKKGAWFITSPQYKHPIAYAGFSNGVSGICYFLLKYMERYKDDRLQQTVSKALHWLMGQAKKSKDGLYWCKHNQTKDYNFWINNGTAGIVPCLIKAYKVLGDLKYKTMAEAALHNCTHHMVDPDFSLANGITGLAETYLLASKVFKEEEWQIKADFTLHTLMRAHLGKDHYYWIVEPGKLPSADLMVGNGGLLHFLLKYQSTHQLDLL